MAKTMKVGKLTYNWKDLIGEGCFCMVYRGHYKSTIFGCKKTVAIKEVPRYRLSENINDFIIERHMELQQKAGDHPNILGFIYAKIDRAGSLYIATELCRGTLEDYVSGTYQGPRFKSETEILYQVAKGLDHLHRKGIVHRDIKPMNLLVFVPSEGSESTPQMKLADCGFSEVLYCTTEHFIEMSSRRLHSNRNDKLGWIAPELYHSKDFYDFKVDIWALGLILGYTLSGGKHPFGSDPYEREFLVMNKNPMLMSREDLKRQHSEDDVPFKLLQSMLMIEPMERPTVEDILRSSFFFFHDTFIDTS